MLVRRTRRAAVVVAGLVFLSVIAACEANPSPAPLPSESPSPSASRSASSSPTVAAPTLPAEAKGTSEASAKAFVRHYFASINHAARTGDTSHLETLGTSECESCVAISNNIAGIYSAGGSIRTGGWKLRLIAPVPSQPVGKPILDLGVLLSPEFVVAKTGADEERFDGGKQPMTMYLTRNASTWQVVRLDKVS